MTGPPPVIGWRIYSTWWHAEPDQARPFVTRRRQIMTLAASGQLAAEPDSYLLRIVLIADGRDRPLCDVPFTLDDVNPLAELAEWAWQQQRRDRLVRQAFAGGASKSAISRCSGLARTTIDRILRA